MQENISGQRKAVSILFSFFLSFFLFLLVLTCIFKSTVLSETYLREKLRTSNYYGNVLKEVEDEFVSYGAASGFDEDFFKNSVEANQLEMDVSQTVSQLYSTGETGVDTAQFEQKLYQNLLANVQSRKIEVTPQVESGLKYLAQNCAASYRQYISLPLVSEIAPVLKKLNTVSNGILFLLVALILFCALLPFSFNRWKHRVARGWIYAVSGTLLMTLIPPIVALLSGQIQRIGLGSNSLNHLAVSYLTGVFTMFFFYVLGLAVLLGILFVTYRWLEAKVKKR